MHLPFQTMLLTDLVFVGRLGPSSLAVIALANIVFNVMFYCLCGLSSAFDTLGAQAHGAGNPSAVRAWAALAAVVNTALCVPMAAVLCWGSGPLSAWALGTDAETSRAVGAFCAGLIPGLLPAALTLVLQKYLTVRGATNAVGSCAVLALVLNAILNQVLIHGWPAVASSGSGPMSWLSTGSASNSNSGSFEGYGIAGSPMATSAARVAQLLLLLGYCWIAPSTAHGSDAAAKERGAWVDTWHGLWRALLSSKHETSSGSSEGRKGGIIDKGTIEATQTIARYDEMSIEQSPPTPTSVGDGLRHTPLPTRYGTIQEEEATTLARSPLRLYLKLGFEGACMFVSEVKKVFLERQRETGVLEIYSTRLSSLIPDTRSLLPEDFLLIVLCTLDYCFFLLYFACLLIQHPPQAMFFDVTCAIAAQLGPLALDAHVVNEVKCI